MDSPSNKNDNRFTDLFIREMTIISKQDSRDVAKVTDLGFEAWSLLAQLCFCVFGHLQIFSWVFNSNRW